MLGQANARRERLGLPPTATDTECDRKEQVSQTAALAVQQQMSKATKAAKQPPESTSQRAKENREKTRENKRKTEKHQRRGKADRTANKSGSKLDCT